MTKWIALGLAALIVVLVVGLACVKIAGLADDELDRINSRDDHPAGRD